MFYRFQGYCNSAKQSLFEELSFFPNNIAAKNLLLNINIQTELTIEDSEFTNVFKVVEPYTMLSQQRLYNLFKLSKYICENNIPGNFVECGVARGGSSALLSYVIKKYSKQPRYLYSFDTFEGMPEPTKEDFHDNLSANEIGWGTGTCAAPIETLMDVVAKFNAVNVIKPIKGYFQNTIPEFKNEIGGIAFLHLDGDWYESTKAILNNLYEQVVENGILQVDDYGFWSGCKKAIHEFEDDKKIKFNLTKIDDTGVWFKKENFTTNDQRSIKNSSKLLNLGCGSHYHKEWVNIDFNSNNGEVIKHNLTKDIPFENNYFDAVYHSHVLEHFPKELAPNFLRECFRVLRKGGIIRVVVPDLEQIIKHYLQLLEESISGDINAQNKYEWIMLELFDQTVRNYSGGEMLKYLQQKEIPSKDFVLERLGSEAKDIINSIPGNQGRHDNVNNCEPDASKIGQFRLSGEIHQWMYDRYSLGKLLKETGFTNIRVLSAYESAIPEFNKYCLDIEADNSTRKPDSLFMEAIK